MKSLLVCSFVMSMFGLNAFADTTLDCRDFSNQAFGGYEVQILTKEDLTSTARVFSKTTVLANLVCNDIESDLTMQDAAQPILGCYEEYLNDSGYSVLLTDEDFSGKQYATLSRVSFTGTKELAKLPCQLMEIQ
ncbi:MAG: hypothetical protein ABIQ95_10025 [Bdellovibrionia bacterium]